MYTENLKEYGFPEDVREHLANARRNEIEGDLSNAGFSYMKAADRLKDIGKIEAAAKYYERAAELYSQIALREEQRNKNWYRLRLWRTVREFYEKMVELYTQAKRCLRKRGKKRNNEKIGKNWHTAYSLYTNARSAYKQFGFDRYSVRRIYVKETDALRKANKYNKEFAKGTNWLEKAWLFVLKYLCNYGMRPSQLLVWIVGIILIFTFAYYPSSYGFIELRSAEGQVWTDSFWSNFTTSLHFSVITFTTLGYGNIYPVGKAAYLITAFESILGYFFWGLLLATLAKKILVF